MVRPHIKNRLSSQFHLDGSGQGGGENLIKAVMANDPLNDWPRNNYHGDDDHR